MVRLLLVLLVLLTMVYYITVMLHLGNIRNFAKESFKLVWLIPFIMWFERTASKEDPNTIKLF